MAASAHIVNLVPAAPGAPLITFLKAASDELRLHILRVLAQDSFSVSELCTIFDLVIRKAAGSEDFPPNFSNGSWEN